MPTLRRSKSLNDKISRQKNRVGDVVRDPRSPDVEGRTRTCVDNFQALVHLRKQTEDKARQLELAYSYATNGHTYLRRGPSGGVELPYASSVTSATKSSRHPDSSESKLPLNRRQHSAEGRTERGVVRRQDSFSGTQQSQQHHQSRREQKRCARPMSMVEPRVGGLFPSQDELNRKDQVIQNLTESQRSLNVHNQKLLSKIDELEFENSQLRDILNAHHIQVEAFTQSRCASTRPHRSISLHGDAMRIPSSSVPSSAVVSPHSETSVSGYGSLADSPSGDGFTAGSDVRVVPRTVGVGDYDDDTLPLSGVSEVSLECKNDTLAKTSSSSSAASRGSRALTLNLDSDRSGHDSNYEEKVDGLGYMDDAGGGEEEGCPRIEELAKQVAELSSQRDTVILRYKQLVEDNLKMVKRDKRIQEELGGLLERHGETVEQVLRSELQIVEEQLKDLTEDVQVQVQRALIALDSPGYSSSESSVDAMDSAVRDMLNRLVDLIGPDYQRLGRRLTVPQQELDKIEKMTQDASTQKNQDACTSKTLDTSTQKTKDTCTQKSPQNTCTRKTWDVLRAWLKRRGGADTDTVPPAVRHLSQALRDVDKDMVHCQHTPVSGPERQALRNCLQFALDHVADPRDVLDHLIALNELTPASISFVQEVMEKRERAVCRLWHVSEYRGTGVVSRLALALARSHYPQVSHRLRDELEIQNSRVHSQCHPASEEPVPAPIPVSVPISVTAASASRPSFAQARSRPMSRVPRFRSKTVDSGSQPVKSPPRPDSSVSAAAKAKPPLLRQAPLARKERELLAPQKERPKSGVQERTVPAPEEKSTPSSKKAPEEKSTPSAKKESPQAPQQQERRILPIPRPFSPSLREKPASPAHKDRPALHLPKERPFSPLGKDGDKTDRASQKDRPSPQTQKDRPFSPFEKDKSTRPFSPFDKDKQSRPFSPFEKDKQVRPFSSSEKDELPTRPFSPVEKDKQSRPFSPVEKDKQSRPFSPVEKDKQSRPFSPVEKDKQSRLFSPLEKDTPTRPFSPFEKNKSAAPAQSERAASQSQKERPFSPFQKERSSMKAVTSVQKERGVASAQKERALSRERVHSLSQKEKQSGAPVKERSNPQSQKERGTVWDKRSSVGSSAGAAPASGARNSVVLEQGGRISRV